MSLEEIQLSTGGPRFKLGLLPPTQDDTALMSRIEVFRDDWIWTDEQIKAALVINGKSRHLLDRSNRAFRVRNQDVLGKCNGSSNASGFEQARENQGLPHVALSDNHVYMGCNGGRDVGSTLPSTYQWTTETGYSPGRLQVGGMTKYFPLNAFNRNQVDPAVLAQADSEAADFRGVQIRKIPIGDLGRFIAITATAIARNLPIIWAWHVGNKGSRTHNGYMQAAHGQNGNHSNLLHSGKWVGGRDKVHPDNMNSWGPSQDELLYGPKGPAWGDGGFALATMDDAYSCAHVHQPYVLMSAGATSYDAALAV